MQVWTQCIGYTYYDTDEQDELFPVDSCPNTTVKLDGEELSIKWVDGVTYEWCGRQIGEGHYYLVAQNGINGEATMHLAPNDRILVGTFQEDDFSGVWKVVLRTAEEHRAAWQCARSELVEPMTPLLRRLLSDDELSPEDESKLRQYLSQYQSTRCPDGGTQCAADRCKTRETGLHWLVSEGFKDFRQLMRHVRQDGPIRIDCLSGDALDAPRLPGSFRSRR